MDLITARDFILFKGQITFQHAPFILWCFPWMYVCAPHARHVQRPEGGIRRPGTGVLDSCELPSGCGTQARVLEGQSVLSSSEPCPQP